MNASDRGQKHICPKCAIKYYDLKKEVIACPGCGATPPEVKLPKAMHFAKKTAYSRTSTGGTAFGKHR